MDVRLSRHGEEILREQLAKGGFRSPEEVVDRALELLAGNGSSGAEADAPSPAMVSRKPEDFAAMLDALASFSDQIPALPGETFSREMIYRDHD